MAIEIPPWLKPPDFAGEYSKGLQIGASIGESQARIAAESAQAAQSAQLRLKELERETTMAQQRIATEQAYHEQMAALRKERLDQFAQENEANTKAAAMKMADQTGFAQDLSNGMTVEQALFRHPSLTTPAAAIAAHKDALDLTSQRIDLSKERLAMQQKALKDKEGLPAKGGTIDYPIGDVFSGKSIKGVPIGSKGGQALLKMMGTNVPPEFLQSTDSAAPAAPTGGGTQPFKEGQIIRNKKTGARFMVVNGEPQPLTDQGSTGEPAPADDQGDAPADDQDEE